MATLAVRKKICTRDLEEDFELVRWIGSGSFGVVYEAKWFNQRIAVKFLHERVLLKALAKTLGKFRTPDVLKGFLETIKSNMETENDLIRSTTEEMDDLAMSYADAVPDDEKLVEISEKIFQIKKDIVDMVLQSRGKLFDLDIDGVYELVNASFHGASDGLLSLQRVYAELMNEATIIRELPAHPNVVSFIGVIQTQRPVLDFSPTARGAEREAQDNNAAFFDNFTPGGTPEPVILMEFVDGIALNDMLNKFPKRFESRRFVANIMHDIARGMQHIHKMNIIHGDLAARNIMIKFGAFDQPTAKITDFGAAVKKWNECDVLEGPPRLPGNISNILPPEYYLSFLGEFKDLGTLGYNLPSDVWQYGLLIYEIEKNNVPFHQHVTPGDRSNFWIEIQREGLEALDRWEDANEGVPFAGNIPFPFTLALDEQDNLSLIAELCLMPDPSSRPTFDDIVGYFMDTGALQKAAGPERPKAGTIVKYEIESEDNGDDDGWVVKSGSEESGDSLISW